MSLVPKDLTPVYKETIGKGAGARRWQRPVYVDHRPPCNQACPAGENIQAWLSLALRPNIALITRIQNLRTLLFAIALTVCTCSGGIRAAAIGTVTIVNGDSAARCEFSFAKVERS